jgi:arylsulfatase A-like enzyme
MRDEIYLILAIDARRRPAIPAEIEHWTRLYDGNLAYADQEIGALRRKLEETGLLEKTVLIIAADHGEGFWEHGHIGHEVLVYEEQSRVPLIIRFPRGTGPSGVRVQEFVSLSDLAPTIADAFGAWRRPAARPAFRTESLLPVVMGAPGRRAVVTRDGAAEPRYAIRDGMAKAIFNTAAGTTELYDLAADPGEQKDLAAQEPIRAAFYRQTLAAWILSRRLEGVAAPVELTSEQRENLKALGYIQ